MRVLALADIHGSLNVYRWVKEVCAEHQADLVTLAGDLFSAGDAEEQREQAQKIVALLKQVRAPVFYIMGNDDFGWLGYEDDQVKCLHGRRLELGGHNFVGYQYSPPFIGGIFEKPEPEMERDLQSLEHLMDERTVFVSHAPVRGVLDRTYGGESVGSEALAALLERKQPLAHIHGHIHESFGRDANHFNVACAGQKRAFLVDLPSLDHRVL